MFLKSILFFGVLSLSLMGEMKRFDVAGLVIDYKTGLAWEDTKSAIEEVRTLSEAKKRCENLSLGGHIKWRIPTLKELKTLLDDKRKNPAIEPIFKYCNSSNYLASNPVATSPNNWVIDFAYGTEGIVSQNMPVYLRCVKR
jgi:hypothetical protein